jgi:hypothetical protein
VNGYKDQKSLRSIRLAKAPIGIWQG